MRIAKPARLLAFAAAAALLPPTASLAADYASDIAKPGSIAPARRSTPASPSAPAPTPALALASLPDAITQTHLDAVTDKDTTYTHIDNDVQTPVPVAPAVVGPVDTIKLQIANRMNTGLITGKLTNGEANEIRNSLDNVAKLEASFKLSYGGINELIIGNLMPKYHMIDKRLNELLGNTNSTDYMPSFENRRAAIQALITYNCADGNLTPVESEQLLVALDGLSDEYASFRATGGTLSASELEALHEDLLNIQTKMRGRIGASLTQTIPDIIVHRSRLRQTIQQGIADCLLSPAESARLLEKYHQLVRLEKSIVYQDGYLSPDLVPLSQEIDNLNFMLTRQLKDRCHVAGQDSLCPF